jgi:glucokinase
MSNTLVADIGGSNTRLAVATISSRPQHMLAFANDTLGGLEAAIESYLIDIGLAERRPDAAVLAIAGPVGGRRIALTNRAWEVDLDAIQRRFGFRYVRALNDFEALAWALPWLEPEDARPLGPELPARNGPRAVLGPGTGLGVAALVPEGHSWFAVPTEAGHMSFGPALGDEWPMFARIAEEVEMVSAETVLSGPGLERLYRAIHPGLPVPRAHEIEALARADDPAALAVVAMFARLLGRFAGNIALAFKAIGGVYVAGGVAAKLGTLINAPAFREAFLAHSPHRRLLEAIPTSLITCEEPVLFGCAAYAAYLAGEG